MDDVDDQIKTTTGALFEVFTWQTRRVRVPAAGYDRAFCTWTVCSHPTNAPSNVTG